MTEANDRTTSHAMALPLAKLKVLELGHIVAGPAAGQILADMGADVIKIESVEGGDQARNMPGSTVAMFHFLNRNKRSVALNLKGPGRDVFLRIAQTADVIIDNFAHGVTDRLGIGYDTVSAINPGLIWLSIKGFLPGPAESRMMLDELAQMAGGLAFMTGTEGNPTRAGASVIDIGAATYGVVAVLAALRQRDQGSGRGQRIVAGLYETSVYLVAQWMATAQYGGEQSVPLAIQQQGTRMGFGTYQLFDTADGSRIFIAITSNAHWERFCTEFDLPALYADQRLKSTAGRVANRPEINKVIAARILQLNEAEAIHKVKIANVPFALVRRPDQLADEEHLIASEQLVSMPFPNGKQSRLPKLPFRASGFDMNLRNCAPALGADTLQTLAELGYTRTEIEELRAAGVIGLSADMSTDKAPKG